MKRIKVDGVDYEPVSNVGGVKIVVLDRGFVVVGNVTIENNYVTIRNCHCIRTWGTERGIGQIAMEGPTSQTKLDAQPTTRVHELQVVQMIDCEATQWKLS